MTSRLVALELDAAEPERVGRFWAGLLGREQHLDAGGVLVAGSEIQVSLRFVPSRASERGPNRVHLHLTSAGPGGQQQTVAAALRLGGRHLDVGQRPEEGHVVLADPEGNELCVIEPHNAYLAGCGLLGELAGDGTRTVGVFWSEALGWPLVWDQDEETAIQSPLGGTKVAWGGPPIAPISTGRRQRLLVAPADADQASEADRLVALGASGLGTRPDGAVLLADPDGNEFVLLSR